MLKMILIGLLSWALPAVQAQFRFATADGAVAITGFNGSPKRVTIPSTINGLPVTRIGMAAFAGSAIISVTIPDSVTNIDLEAFAVCANLTNVIMGAGVTRIGEYAFSGCSRLTSIVIPGSVSSWGDYAFSDCFSLVSVTVGDGVPIGTGVTRIGNFAFFNCNQLSSAIIGDGVIGIETAAFASTRLVAVAIPRSVASIRNDAFAGCTSLAAISVDPLNPAYASVAGVLFDRNRTTLITYPAGRSGTAYAIPNSVTNVGGDAFLGASLASVEIPEGVTDIGDDAFGVCASLVNVTIPKSVLRIGNYAFRVCTSLASLTIPEGVASIGDSAFLHCSSLVNLVIPNGVVRIGDHAFTDCISLVFISIPEGVTNIGVGTFQGCISLEGATIPEGVAKVEDYLFAGCTALGRVALGGRIASIGSGAFSRCVRLTRVEIPGSVTNIGGHAFSHAGLAGVYFLGDAPGVDPTAFQPLNQAVVYYLPGTAGWSASFGGLRTERWIVPLRPPSGAIHSAGFTISWAAGFPAVVEATADLSNPVWEPVQTNSASAGFSYFTDSRWTNHPARFYRLGKATRK